MNGFSPPLLTPFGVVSCTSPAGVGFSGLWGLEKTVYEKLTDDEMRVLEELEAYWKWEWEKILCDRMRNVKWWKNNTWRKLVLHGLELGVFVGFGIGMLVGGLVMCGLLWKFG